MADLALGGVYPALATPFEDGRVALDLLRHNVRAYNAAPLAGYVALGSAGEFPHLDWDEKLAVVDAVAEEAACGRLVVAGVGELETRRAVRLAKELARAGAGAVMVVPPFYFRPAMDERALAYHFRMLAEDSPVPVILYNIPSHAGVAVPTGLVAELAEHENVLGIKDSSGDLGQLQAYLDAARQAGGPAGAPAPVSAGGAAEGSEGGFAVLAGTVGTFWPGLLAGVSGAILGEAGFLPWETCELYQAVLAGDQERAADLHRRLLAAARAVSGRFGVAGIKAAMDLFGYFGCEVRAPLRPIGEAERNEIRAVLIEAGFMKGD